jgi:hypothetical protein
MKQFFVLAALVAILGTTASAKGVTTKITVTGPDLRGPIVIADANLVNRFNIWSGPGVEINNTPQLEGFIADWSSGAVDHRPAGLRHYEVSFFVRFRDGGDDELAYVVDYESGPVDGYVFIPGKSDERYRLNTRSIFRGVEGRWFHATPESQQFARKRLIG